MRTHAPLLIALLLLPALAGAREAVLPAAPDACTTCGNDTYGTSIRWVGSPAEAARQAKREEKLVFVLHVSGHFEDAAFT